MTHYTVILFTIVKPSLVPSLICIRNIQSGELLYTFDFLSCIQRREECSDVFMNVISIKQECN